MTTTLSAVEAAAVAAIAEAIVGALLDLLALPSVTGSPAESEMQHVLARRPAALRAAGAE
jgi:acetylornithine deacetylase